MLRENRLFAVDRSSFSVIPGIIAVTAGRTNCAPEFRTNSITNKTKKSREPRDTYSKDEETHVQSVQIPELSIRQTRDRTELK